MSKKVHFIINRLQKFSMMHKILIIYRTKNTNKLQKKYLNIQISFSIFLIYYAKFPGLL